MSAKFCILIYLSRLDKIDPAIASIGADLATSSKLTQTYGLAFLVGAVQDILGEFLGKCRQPTEYIN